VTMTEILDGRSDAPAKLAGQNRIRLVAICFSLAFLAIAAQLANLTILKGPAVEEDALAQHQPRSPRPDIVDRNGVVIATDIAVASLYADPRKIIDIDDAVESLTASIPDLDAKALRVKLTQPGRAFVWLNAMLPTISAFRGLAMSTNASGFIPWGAWLPIRLATLTLTAKALPASKNIWMTRVPFTRRRYQNPHRKP